MAHDVFISYSHHDKPTADAVCAKLEEDGIRCWYAPRDIQPGADWAGSIVHAIEAHHNDVEPNSVLDVLVQAADAVSAARPGARKETLDAYIKRLEKLEEIANSYEGVERTYAIQAGRELRVIVGADQVSDAECDEISNEVARRIQDEMTYPGQVKVTVLREVRSVAFAK